MSDAAQIIAAHTFGRWERFGCDNPNCDWVADTNYLYDAQREHAAHVLAVLSETHAVVELPEDPDGYEYGIRRDELIDRHPDMAYCNGVLDQEVARDVARWHPEVTLVRRVYGPWMPVADAEVRDV